MSTASEEQPYGRRLLISVVEERASRGHQQPYACLPLSNDPRAGFRDISYQLLKTAIDRCAWFLDEKVGKARNFETLGWMALPSDFRYVLLGFAAMKTGHKIFLPSPRNSMEANLSLLAQCDCNIFLRPARSPLPVVEALANTRPLRLINVPDVEYFLDSTDPVPHYPCNKTFHDNRFDTCIVSHTSGTTGIPKAVPIKHGWFCAMDAQRNLPQNGKQRTGFDVLGNVRCFFPFPLFHAAAAGQCFAAAVFWNITYVLAPPTPLTAELANSFHVHAGVEASLLPSSVLKDIAANPEFLENVARLKYIAFSGSPLAPEAGNPLATKTRVFNIMGSTEACALSIEFADADDWAYLHFSPQTGVELRQRTESNFELVVVRDPKLDLIQPIFVTFPELQEWPTRDLFSKHPTKPNHWLYEGRTDDIVVFSNGEKLNPQSIEQTVSQSPNVAAALVAGEGKFQPCLLIEPQNPTSSLQEQAALLEKIWPTIQQVNHETVAHGRIDKRFVTFTAPERPLLRAAKGSVQRKLSLQLYAKELEGLYEKAGQGVSPEIAIDFTKPEATRSLLRRWISEQGGPASLTDDADLFSQGVDSLQVLNLSRNINSSYGQPIATPQLVYNCGTIARLADALARSHTTEEPQTKTRGELMNSTFKRFAEDLPIVGRRSAGANVILTGSTGSLGSYLLQALAAKSQVRHIYCLNRTADASKRQATENQARGLPTSMTADRVTFLQCDFSKPYLGLGIEQYGNLIGRVTHIIHNAWPVDFNLPMQSFVDAHIGGVRQLIDFSAHSSHGASIYFLSSISTVQNWSSPGSGDARKVPECLFGEWNVSAEMGYAQSKLVSEQLLASAAALGSVPASICRLGQIAGPVLRGKLGMWGKREWLPSLITSSRYLGVVPADLGPGNEIDWVPVDLLADVVVNLALGPYPHGTAGVHHIVNPHKVLWSEGLSQVLTTYFADARVVPFIEWVDCLAKSAEQGTTTTTDIEKNPAIKLLPFFQTLQAITKAAPESKSVTLDTTETERMSHELSSIGPVTETWMRLWFEQWGY